LFGFAQTCSLARCSRLTGCIFSRTWRQASALATGRLSLAQVQPGRAKVRGRQALGLPGHLLRWPTRSAGSAQSKALALLSFGRTGLARLSRALDGHGKGKGKGSALAFRLRRIQRAELAACWCLSRSRFPRSLHLAPCSPLLLLVLARASTAVLLSPLQPQPQPLPQGSQTRRDRRPTSRPSAHLIVHLASLFLPSSKPAHLNRLAESESAKAVKSGTQTARLPAIYLEEPSGLIELQSQA